MALYGYNLSEAVNHYRELRDRKLISDLVCFQRILQLNTDYAMETYGKLGMIYITLLNSLAGTSVSASDITLLNLSSSMFGGGSGSHSIMQSFDVSLSLMCFPSELFQIHKALFEANVGYTGHESDTGWDITGLDRWCAVLNFKYFSH